MNIHFFVDNKLLGRKYKKWVGVAGYDTRPRLEGSWSRLPVPCTVGFADGRPDVEVGVKDRNVWIEFIRALPNGQKVIFDYYDGIRLVGRTSYEYDAHTDGMNVVEDWYDR